MQKAAQINDSVDFRAAFCRYADGDGLVLTAEAKVDIRPHGAKPNKKCNTPNPVVDHGGQPPSGHSICRIEGGMQSVI